MAFRPSITSARVAGTVAAGVTRRISVLFALRSGISALTSTLSTIATAGDEKAEHAFEASLDELNQLDNEILAAPALDLGDIRAKASIVRQRAADDVLLDGQLGLFLDSIDGFDRK